MSDAQDIMELAERMGWEVETNSVGELVILTGVEAPGFDPAEARRMRMWEEKDAQEKLDMSR